MALEKKKKKSELCCRSALKRLYLDMRQLSTLWFCFFLDFSIKTANKANANFMVWMVSTLMLLLVEGLKMCFVCFHMVHCWEFLESFKLVFIILFI